jgi:hypothetical protein
MPICPMENDQIKGGTRGRGEAFVPGSSDEVVIRPFVRFGLCPVPGAPGEASEA